MLSSRLISRTLLAFVLLTGTASALDTSKLEPTGYVNDFAHVLSPSATATLEAYCTAVEQATGAQFAVVTLDSLDGEPIENISDRLYRQWGVGKKGQDEGLLLLIAIQDRKQRAEVGYGLEPVITDSQAGTILRGVRPILRQGDYGGAMLAALEQFGAKVADAKGVAIQGTPRRDTRPRSGRGFNPLGLIFIIVLFFLLARGGGGGAGGFLTGMLLGNLMGGGRRGWGGGGFGGYDGGSGGGFGGFGGGSSGGGGASSDW